MPDLSIVTVNYNAKDYLDRCLGSVIKTTSNISSEIIVVDNASVDGSTTLVKEKYPQVKIISNKQNFGFAKAVNQGITSSVGKHIMLLNNDVVVNGKAVETMLEMLENNDKVGAIGPKLLNADGTIQYQCRRGFPTPFNAFCYFSGLSRIFPKSEVIGSYLKSHLDDKETIEVDSLCGAAMIVRREIIEDVGLMDEGYFMYGDDIDLCYRIKQAGWKIFYLPHAEMIHYGGKGGSRKQSYRNIFEFHRAMAVFYSKHYSHKHLFLLNWIIYIGIWVKCVIALVQNLFRREKYVGTRKP